MTTRIASTNIQSNTILTTNLAQSTIDALQGSAVPTITQIQITTSGYVVKDDTAVSTSGGYIKITGTNFTAGSQVVIGSTPATSVGFVNSTTLNVQVPALAAGTYVVYVTINTGSVAIMVNGLTYSGDPAWVTGSTLTSGQVDSAISIQLSATGDAPVTYALQAGSSLPAGLTLTSGGLLSGTVTGITVETTYNFTIEAIDAQAQESPRTFSITITASDQFFEYVTTLLSAANPSSTFVTDASTNNFAVSVFGDTRPNSFGPYTPGYYSAYFDTSGDSLTVPYGSTLALGTSNCTIEFWAYLVSYPQEFNNVVDVREGAGTYSTDAISFGFTNAGAITFYAGSYSPNSPVTETAAALISLNAWNHVALVRSSGTTKIYLNGVERSTTANSWNQTSGTASLLYIANALVSRQVNGYISNLRIVKGVAVYTGSFIPPTSPLAATQSSGTNISVITGTQTALLTCQSNRFIDASTNNFTITRNGDTLVSGFDPFAPVSAYSTYGSGYFDGTGDYLSLPAGQANLQPGSGNFTIEFWYNIAAAPGGYINLFSYGSVGTNLRLFLYTTNSFTLFDGGSLLITANNAVVINAWNHVAVVRNSNTITLYVNGVSVGTASNSTNFVGSLNIGFESGQTLYTGYMADFRLVKGTAVYTSSFTPPAAPLTAVANTQLLTLQNNQPNNNSMFLDSSTNNFLITRNGNTTQGSFSPYGGGWSNYFDGTGDYLSISFSSSLYLSNSDFTIEAWVYFNSVASGQQPFCGYDGSTINWAIYTASNGTLNYYLSSNGTTWNLASGVAFGNIAANTWYHIALVRNGSTVTPYINGVAGTTTNVGSSSIFSTSQPNYIGGMPSGFNFTGYISNHRIVIGTAVYTTAFTPPTAPLTPIANTRLLTCADNRFVDDSGNNFTITRNGDVSIQRFNPFNPALTTPTSYSGYFDGNGDSLSYTGGSSLAFGTSDFTIELWAYMANTGTFSAFLRPDDTGTFPEFGYDWSATQLKFDARNAAIVAVTTTAVVANAWNHIAVSRSGTSLRLFVNGSQVGSTTTNSTNFGTTTGTIRIGGSGFSASHSVNGYISNFRVVNGTAVYTSNFTPSTTPLTAIANTSLLTLQNATFVDNSTNNFTITANGNSQPTQFNPFGWTSTTGSNAAYSVANYGGSMYFDGTGDFLLTPSDPAFTLGSSGDFTIECWFYLSSSPSNYAPLATTWTDAASSGGYNNRWALAFFNSRLSWFTSAGSINVQDPTNIVLNQWTHVAIMKSGSTFIMYKNGVLVGSNTTTDQNYTTQGALRVGSVPSGGSINGYITNLRILRGQALYTSNFAPPVAPLSFNANAVLQVNGTSAAIYDSAMITTYETLGNSSTTGVIKKYGNSSLSFDGTGDYLSLSNNFAPFLNWYSGNFTLEYWIYANAFTQGGNNESVVIGNMNPTTSSNYWSFGPITGGTVRFYYWRGSQQSFTTTTALATGQWYHLAFVNNGGALAIYINGVSSATASIVGSPVSGTDIPFTIGSTNNAALNGYLDDVRITRGVARYTANFTPPTSPVIQF